MVGAPRRADVARASADVAPDGGLASARFALAARTSTRRAAGSHARAGMRSTHRRSSLARPTHRRGPLACVTRHRGPHACVTDRPYSLACVTHSRSRSRAPRERETGESCRHDAAAAASRLRSCLESGELASSHRSRFEFAPPPRLHLPRFEVVSRPRTRRLTVRVRAVTADLGLAVRVRAAVAAEWLAHPGEFVLPPRTRASQFEVSRRRAPRVRGSSSRFHGAPCGSKSPGRSRPSGAHSGAQDSACSVQRARRPIA